MGFQNYAGGIVLDATLTDIGRKYMAKGTFKATKFALGDDEIDYAMGNSDSGTWELNTPGDVTILEAPAQPSAVINSTLIDFKREDLFFLPEYKMNQAITGAVKLYSGVIHLAVNDETTTKLKKTIDVNEYVLQNESEITNMVVLECGIESGSEGEAGPPIVASSFALPGTLMNQERFIYNYDLYDKYAFLYCDSRFFRGVLTSNPSATFTNDDSDNLYQNLQPLQKTIKTSLPSLIEEQDTYYCTAVRNSLIDPSIGFSALSAFSGPRSTVLGLNFILNDKLISNSNGSADARYSKFGKTSKDLFGDGNLYDYIDTRVTVEGCATGRQSQLSVRIVRFSGT